MVSNLLLKRDKSHLPGGFDQHYLLVPPAHFGGYPRSSCGNPQPSYLYRLPVRPERGPLSSRSPNRSNQTHVEDVKDPDEILPPSRNLVFIALRMDESGGCVPFPLLDNLPLDLGQGSAIENTSKRITQRAHHWSGSHSQTSHRIQDRVVELIQSSPFQSPVESLAYVSASPSKVDIILIVGNSVLVRRESEVRLRREQEETYPNRNQEDASRAEGDLSWRNGACVFGKG